MTNSLDTLDQWGREREPRKVEHEITIVCLSSDHRPRRLDTMTKLRGRLLWEHHESTTRRGVHVYRGNSDSVRKNQLRGDSLRRPGGWRGKKPSELIRSDDPQDRDARRDLLGLLENDRTNLDIRCPDCSASANPVPDSAIRFRDPVDLHLVLNELARQGETLVRIRQIRQARETLKITDQDRDALKHEVLSALAERERRGA